MGKGNRGFKPQGIENPLLMARLSRPIQTGPTIRDRLDRARPSWQDIKVAAQKKETSASDYLEHWENEKFRDELAAIRESKRSRQEKDTIDQLEKHRKRISKRRSSSSFSSSPLSDDEYNKTLWCRWESLTGKHRDRANYLKEYKKRRKVEIQRRSDSKIAGCDVFNIEEHQERHTEEFKESNGGSDMKRVHKRHDERYQKRKKRYRSSSSRESLSRRQERNHHDNKRKNDEWAVVQKFNPHRMSNFLSMSAHDEI